MLSRVRPPDSVIVNESTSTMAQQIEWLPTVRTGSFFATASGGIGWGVPAAVGVALADRDRGVSRPVIGLIGDGSSQYSVQALWTAAQHKLPIVYVVMRNNEYSILKSFAVLEETPGVPGLDLPGLGIAALARGWGCRAVDVETTEELEQEFKTAPERRHHDGHRGAHPAPEGDALRIRSWPAVPTVACSTTALSAC